MRNLQIPYERLLRQRIAGEGLQSPTDVVRWLGAVQAQDYAAAKGAVGLRTAACTENQIEDAFTDGEILRTHVMRPTWHFVDPEDIRWMQMLTSRRVNALMAYQFRQLELDAALFKRSTKVIVKALRGGKQLTREELGSALEKAGIPATGLRLAHIVSRAELDAVICSGGRRGKQFTYALVEERAPNARNLTREEALALLTERYFTSRGPATLQDYAWWSGLTAADVKAGLEMVGSKLICEVIEGQDYWLTDSAPAARFSRGSVHLLGNYDEYIVGYTDRKAIFDDSHARHLDARHNPLFNHTIVSAGRIAGTWKRTAGKDSVAIEAKLFVRSTKAEVRTLGLAAKRLAQFMELRLSDFKS